MTNASGLLVAAAGLFVFGAACASNGAGGRKVEITQKDDGCSPTSVAVTPGEKLNLLFKNQSSQDAYEAEGVDGAALEEFVVHKGRTLSVGFDVPPGGAVHKIKCYVPAGISTIIELVAGDGSATKPAASASAVASPSANATAPGGASAGTTVAVTLVDHSVAADKPTVQAGKIRFIATNTSATQVHELAVLKTKPDGSYDKIGEIPAIDPEKGGSIVLDLTPGAYELACLIIIGEAGSMVDHYQQGMHTAFTVQ